MIEVRIAHAPALALMHEAAFPADPWDAASFITLLNQPGAYGIIDERGGFLLLRAVLDEAEILTIGTTAPGQGIGSALMQAAINHAAANRIHAIHLEVAEDNVPARALYAKFGFAQTGMRLAYYPDGGDALTLTRFLKEEASFL